MIAQISQKTADINNLDISEHVKDVEIAYFAIRDGGLFMRLLLLMLKILFLSIEKSEK